MSNITEQLQKEVYKIDKQIGIRADDLLIDSRKEVYGQSDRENYDKFCLIRSIILECIEKLKPHNI